MAISGTRLDKSISSFTALGCVCIRASSTQFLFRARRAENGAPPDRKGKRCWSRQGSAPCLAIHVPRSIALSVCQPRARSTRRIRPTPPRRHDGATSPGSRFLGASPVRQTAGELHAPAFSRQRVQEPVRPHCQRHFQPTQRDWPAIANCAGSRRMLSEPSQRLAPVLAKFPGGTDDSPRYQVRITTPPSADRRCAEKEWFVGVLKSS